MDSFATRGCARLLGALAPCLLAGGLLLAVPAPARADLRLCNTTQSRVGVSIGYKDGDGWTTEGWWNLAPRACETILRGPLVARYYYLHAVDYDQGGEWAGRAFMCTRDREFTIRGIEECIARGYDRTGFFEIDTRDQRQWTVQLTDSAPRPPRPGQPPMAAPLPPPPPARGRGQEGAGEPDVRQASPGRSPRSTPLPGAPAGEGGGAAGLPGGIPAFTTPR